MYFAIGVEPTNEIDFDVGVVEQAVDGHLVAVSTLKTPSGRPASCEQLGQPDRGDGSFSLGLSTTVLPTAIAIGKNHIGTMAGKLKGLMMPDDAERLLGRVDVDAGRDLLGCTRP